MGKTSRFVRAIVAGLLIIGLVPASRVQAATVTKTVPVLYGPFSIPAGTLAVPGELSRLRFGVARPCNDCYITQFQPDLVYAADPTTSATLRVGHPVATIRQGDTVRLHSMYQSSHEASDVMGIMLAYVDPN